jgi:iron complex outermembrane receptor protein
MMELPLSTGQITGKLLEDQNILNVTDALKNVSGVAVDFGGANQPIIANIRGFNASIFKDGYRMGGCDLISPGGNLPIDMTSLERIEVLKGPSAILYGRGEPGGIINFISKKPRMTSDYSLEAMTGSFQQYKVGASATGALIDDVLAYRFDGTYDNSKSYRDVVKMNSFFLKPSFSLNASDNTHFRLLGEYSKSEYTPDRGLLMLPSITSSGALTASLPHISSRNYFFGEDVDKNSQKQFRTTAEVEHVFSPEWTLRGSASYEQTHQLSTDVFDWYYIYQGATPPGFPEGLFPPNWTVRPINTLDLMRSDFSLRIENVFHASHTLFGMNVSHRILAATDLLQIDTRYILDYSPWGILNPATGERIRMMIPVYPHEEMHANSKDYGIAVQDLITFAKRWHLLIGGRYERNTIDVTQLAAFNTIPDATCNKSNGIAPRFGLLYQMSENLSLYASYMGSYQSPGAEYSLWDIPESLRPERAYQTEVGVKFEVFDRRALVTTSVYLIKKYDVITWELNPNAPTPYLLYYNISLSKDLTE